MIERICKKNYHYWKNELIVDADYKIRDCFDCEIKIEFTVCDNATFFRRVPASHTWGLQKRESLKDARRKFLYEKILFEDKALLSRYLRDGLDESNQTEGDIELKNYVYAFIGVHEPHYTGFSFPGFGVFIKKDIENQSADNVVALRKNPFLNKDINVEELLLLPEDGRAISEIDSLVNYSADIWRYWGYYDVWKDTDRGKKVELLYKYKVSVDDFAAILWPVEKAILSNNKGYSVCTDMENKANKFKKEHSGCAIVKYPYNFKDAYDGNGFYKLIKASSLTAKYYEDNGKFPEEITDDWELI